MAYKPNINEANRLFRQDGVSERLDLAHSNKLAVFAVRAAYLAEAAWENARAHRKQIIEGLDEMMFPDRTIHRHSRDGGADMDIRHETEWPDLHSVYPDDHHDRYVLGEGGAAERIIELRAIRALRYLGGATLRRAARRNVDVAVEEGEITRPATNTMEGILHEATNHTGLRDDLAEHKRQTAIATALLAPRPESDPDGDIVAHLFAGTQGESYEAMAEKFWPATEDPSTWGERSLPDPSWPEDGVFPVAVNVRVIE